jgi:predicted nucleotidyltransferase
MSENRNRLDLRPISVLIEEVILAWQPEAIWLFGSRARGQADDQRDWDLLGVIPDDATNDKLLDPMTAWKLKRETNCPASLIACSVSDFLEGSKIPNTLAYEVAQTGLRI